MTYKRLVGVASLALLVCIFSSEALTADTSNGATDFTFHGKGQWWHNTGYAKELTQFAGPFDNAAQHPGELFMTFWKEPDADAHDGLSPALDAKDFRVLRSLGTTFYYRASEPAPPDPATLGYSAEDFANADAIADKFPLIDAIFPKGLTASGCQKDGVQYFLIQGNGMTGAFLVDWVAADHSIDVAVIPAKALKGSFESILDNLNYYSSGGMVEFMDFGGHYYYLSRLAQSPKFDPSAPGTAAAACPDTPVATEKGIEYPKSWTDAIESLTKRSSH